MKADKPVSVTLEIGGTFDGKPQAVQEEFQIGTEWTQINRPFTPPKALSASLAASITVQEEATVLVDSVYFFPSVIPNPPRITITPSILRGGGGPYITK